MKTYKKINFYFMGSYWLSTMQSKTCKEAKKKYIDHLEYMNHSFAGLTLTQRQILNYPEQLKANFAKD
jgi:hypothetical protein